MVDGTETEGFDEPETGEGEPTVRELDARLDRIEDMLSRLVPTGSHADAQARTERRLDRPTEIADAVRAELDARDARRSRESAAAAESRSVSDRLTALEEKPPEPPESPVTRFMWGKQR